MDKENTRIQKFTCEKIKYYRRISGFSQADMAEKLWMSQRAYHRLENGETALTLERVHQLAKIFNVSIIHLVDFSVEPRNTEVLKEFRELNKQIAVNEKKIIEILKELKNRIS
jgi:transcriptional regulator with XRE-family HTH domain